jgi:hypothetical protein
MLVILSKKLYMYMCPIPNRFRDRVISWYSSRIVDKREILRTVSNTGIYCSNDKVCTVCLVKYIFENSTVSINALCNSCEKGISAFVNMCEIFHNIPTMPISRVTTANWRFTLFHVREGRIILGAKPKLLYSEIALSRKPFGIGHMYIYSFA